MRPGDYIAIPKNCHSGRAQRLWARPGIQEGGGKPYHLDPGSHPAAQDLAGMTNWDSVYPGYGVTRKLWVLWSSETVSMNAQNYIDVKT